MNSLIALTFSQPVWGNAALVEVVWTAFGAIGSLITLAVLLEARKDLIAVKKSGTSSVLMFMQAKANQNHEFIRLIKMYIIVGTGIVAMIQPSSSRLTLSALIIVIGLILIAVLTSFQSWLNLRLRRNLRGHQWQ